MNCDKCGNIMIQLSPWDFKRDVCLNHNPPHFVNQNWCGSTTYEDRELMDWETTLIESRATALQMRLKVVKTPKEILTVVYSFLEGGWNPEIDERITGKKGVHL